jgi:hypothetical protein
MCDPIDFNVSKKPPPIIRLISEREYGSYDDASNTSAFVNIPVNRLYREFPHTLTLIFNPVMDLSVGLDFIFWDHRRLLISSPTQP